MNLQQPTRSNFRQKSPTQPTSSHLKEVASCALKQITQKFTSKEVKVLELWPQIIGNPFQNTTKATKFDQGKLFITVANSTVMSMINVPQVKKTILETYRREAPEFQIREIIFRIGVVR